eukprot:CAMPEP_0172917218 /NCGR_PEP_ID=MMETSP1075-20121228/197892_1 /TAXON_ID=2916 /ORGANISM="Ceratium fusus, Strain PA161109" /LENGTH=219 /DNA_ID=CAMNT_0013776649 /DNA_START=1 /DNA_END=657 /DNA_ORIENTATION=-
MQMDEDSMVAYVRMPSLLPKQWNDHSHDGAAAGEAASAAAGAATGKAAGADAGSPSHHQTMDSLDQNEVLTPRDRTPSIVIENSGFVGQQQCVEKTASALAEGAQKIKVSLFDMLLGEGNGTEWQEGWHSGFDAGIAVAAAATTWEKPNAQCTEEKVRATVSILPDRVNIDLETSNSSPTASLGSIGHPVSCAKACKFIMKKRGCKDGALCDHCHLCEW